MAGPGTVYLPLSQLDKSTSAQRLEQKGRKASSVAFLHIGHLFVVDL
jgi:hypothetical protein